VSQSRKKARIYLAAWYAVQGAKVA